MFWRMSVGKLSCHGCGWLPAGFLSRLTATLCPALLVSKAGTIIPPLGQPRGLILLAAELSEHGTVKIVRVAGSDLGPGLLARGPASSFLHPSLCATPRPNPVLPLPAALPKLLSTPPPHGSPHRREPLAGSHHLCHLPAKPGTLGWGMR